jgi:hypothetical protein
LKTKKTKALFPSPKESFGPRQPAQTNHTQKPKAQGLRFKKGKSMTPKIPVQFKVFLKFD